MARPKVEAAVRLSARITTNTATKKDVEFIEEKLKTGMSQAAIIREAIAIYRRKDEGKLVEINELLDSFDENKIESKRKNKLDEKGEEKIKEATDKVLNQDIF